MLGEQFERDLLVLCDFIQKTIEDCTDDEIKSIFKLLGQNQQGIGTCSLTTWLKVIIFFLNFQVQGIVQVRSNVLVQYESYSMSQKVCVTLFKN